MDGARARHCIGQLHPIADHSAIDENRHMLAQRELIIKHIAARLRVEREDIVQHLAHRAAGSLYFRATDVALDIRGENDLCHSTFSSTGIHVKSGLTPFCAA